MRVVRIGPVFKFACLCIGRALLRYGTSAKDRLNGLVSVRQRFVFVFSMVIGLEGCLSW